MLLNNGLAMGCMFVSMGCVGIARCSEALRTASTASRDIGTQFGQPWGYPTDMWVSAITNAISNLWQHNRTLGHGSITSQHEQSFPWPYDVCAWCLFQQHPLKPGWETPQPLWVRNLHDLCFQVCAKSDLLVSTWWRNSQSGCGLWNWASLHRLSLAILTTKRCIRSHQDLTRSGRHFKLALESDGSKCSKFGMLQPVQHRKNVNVWRFNCWNFDALHWIIPFPSNTLWSGDGSDPFQFPSGCLLCILRPQLGFLFFKQLGIVLPISG